MVFNFQQYFSYNVAVSFIGGGNRSTRRKPPTRRRSLTRRAKRYQRGNQNPQFEKDWQHNGQKREDKKLSTKHAHKTKNRATRTPLKTKDELWSSWRVSSSCTTSGTGRVNLVINLVICHEWEKNLYKLYHITLYRVHLAIAWFEL
jgi:hypothetical protein